MYTKSQLMESLAEQKEHTLRLVDKVDELAGGLGDMEVTTRYDRVIRLSKSECALRGALRGVLRGVLEECECLKRGLSRVPPSLSVSLPCRRASPPVCPSPDSSGAAGNDDPFATSLR